MNDMWQVFPSRTEEVEAGVVEENYDVLAGNLDSKELGLILAIDSKNGVNKTLLETLGFSGKKMSALINFSEKK